MTTNLPGSNPTAYLGLKETNPPQLYFFNRAPTSADARPYDRGDIWIDQVARDAYILVFKSGATAQWEGIGGTAAETLTGDSGGPVGPDGSNNINILGGAGIDVSGNPGTNTLTVALTGGGPAVYTLTGNAGGAVPADGSNNINVVGTGNITVTGNPGTNTLTIADTIPGSAVEDDFTPALGQTNFTLSSTPGSNDAFALYLNGQLRLRGTDYTQVGTALTWLDPAGETLVTTDLLVARYNDLAPAGGVSSVFGRAGAVVAVLGDYAGSLITNDSAVVGATVTDALNTINGLLPAPVTSVFGRVGIVVATAGDYAASLITNDSTVAGAFVDDALNTLGGLVANKSRFYNVTNGNTTTGTYRTRSVGASGAWEFNGTFPADFNSITKIAMIGFPSAGAAGAGKDIDIYSNYGAVGEAYNFNSESDTTTTYNTGVANQFFELDLSAIFTSPSANDFFGVQIDHQGIGGAIEYLGVLLEYT